MIKKIIGIPRKDENTEFPLIPSQKQEIASNICVTNWKRIRIFMFATLFFEILLVIFNDIPAINTSLSGELWLAKSYFILHLIIGVTAFLGVILLSVFLKINLDKKLTTDYLSPILPLIILICLSIITGLDQIKTGQISVFVINLLVSGVLIIIPPIFSFFLFAIPFGVFVVQLFIYQPDVTMRNYHIINGGIFLVAVLLLSKFIYDNHVSHVVKNIKLEEANQRLLILSLHDPLTNLSNRRNFEAHIEHELALIRRFNQLAWLILIDIDHFKNINDLFGHNVGDRVLVEVANLLQKNIRDVDLACRWGGEEFLLLITRVEPDEIMLVANRICNTLAKTPLNIEGLTVPVTASFGVSRLMSQKQEDQKDFLACYKKADRALYNAKLGGRNRVVMGD